MNVICSIISLRILKSLAGCSALFIWHESVSGVLMLLAAFLSVSLHVFWNFSLQVHFQVFSLPSLVP